MAGRHLGLFPHRHRHQGLPHLRHDPGAAAALPSRRHHHRQSLHRGSVSGKRPAGRGSQLRHLQAQGGYHLERWRAAHFGGCQIHLAVDHHRVQRVGEYPAMVDDRGCRDAGRAHRNRQVRGTGRQLVRATRRWCVYGAIIPAHAFGGDPANRNIEFDSSPLGTGAFKMESFSPNDLVVLAMNENYWQPNAPYFASVTVKGGGDAASAARAVLQTGEYEYAWNLQVEPAVLNEMLEGGDAKGDLYTVQGISIERININFSDPDTEVDGQFSHYGTPNPIMSDPAVRQAMNKALKRELIANEFYGEGQPATPNILTGLDIFESPNTSWEYDLEEATQILEDAGWVLEGDVRVKDGVELEVSYSTSVNQVRQKTQAVVKESFGELGIQVRLEQIDAGIFFGGEAGNTQNINHFYWDIDMYTSSPSSTIPSSFMLNWYAGPNGDNIAQASNDWQGQNFHRYSNPDYDALYDELITLTDAEAAYNTLIAMNDILINDVVVIPEVNRAADKYAISSRLNNEVVALGAFELNYWNIANWNRA